MIDDVTLDRGWNRTRQGFVILARLTFDVYRGNERSQQHTEKIQDTSH